MLSTARQNAIAEDGTPEASMRILIFMKTYLPGFKSGGPVRAISNMIETLAGTLNCFVVTHDRDVGDTTHYPNIVPNCWHETEDASIFYSSSITFATVLRAYRDVKPSLIYLNSFYGSVTRLVLLSRRVGLLGNVPILIAPRGEFSPEAMKIKKYRKLIYRRFSTFLGLYRGLDWQVSSPHEKEDLLRATPQLAPDVIHLTREFSSRVSFAESWLPKEPGKLRLVFVARISEMKNVDFLFRLLPRINGELELNLYGPVADGDASYWRRCQRMLDGIPANIKATYHGSIVPENVPTVHRRHHFLILPTRGENFCHSAVEALNNGIPVILSDATPWRNLSHQRAGFDIPLSDENAWTAAIQHCVDMDAAEYSQYLEGVRKYRSLLSPEDAITQHKAMFETVIGR
jgi:glycosyltransferase involved in cell wall biosynthesis